MLSGFGDDGPADPRLMLPNPAEDGPAVPKLMLPRPDEDGPAASAETWIVNGPADSDVNFVS